MAITYNSTAVSDISYNSNDISEGTYNGTTVFTDNQSVLIIESYHLETETSVVPPPYDEGGYNYSATAPEKTALASLDLGDITNYNYITFEWNNIGTANGYGDFNGWVIIDGVRLDLFNNVIYNQDRISATIDVSSLSGSQMMDIHLSAKSRSSYRGYVTRASVNLYNISGSTAPTPEPETDYSNFTLESGDSRVPGPYDENGYNYNGTAPTKTETYILNLGDVTDLSEVSFHWDNTGSAQGYGDVYAKYKGLDDSDVILFKKTVEGAGDVNVSYGDVTIDLTSYTGNKSIVFTVYAKSRSSYRGSVSHVTLNVSNIVAT